jgi:tellurite resistance protein TerC
VNVPLWVWLVTVAALVIGIAGDLVLSFRNPHEVRPREAALWAAGSVTLAVAFGIGIAIFSDGEHAGEFFAGYLTEYSLSVDNLFVFVVIITTFHVPVLLQHRVLLVGIVLALILRGGLIAVGAAAIHEFSVTFYLFGAFLLYTAFKVATTHGKPPDLTHNPALRLVERRFPTTRDYHGGKTVVRIDGKRMITPLLIVMIAIGTTDVVFALDSIPAIFGLTDEAYLVFTANAFALLGLRQLYFLLHGLLDRLIYLAYGLAVILAFIGVKLVLAATHDRFGEPWPEISITVSLAVIIGTLAVTTVASLLVDKRRTTG